jgi:hypothetical protein
MDGTVMKANISNRKEYILTVVICLAIIIMSVILSDYISAYTERTIGAAREKSKSRNRGAFATDVEDVLLSDRSNTNSPYVALFQRARRIAVGEATSSSTWAAVQSDKSVGKIIGLTEQSKGISTVQTALAVTNLHGYPGEEARLLKILLRYENNQKLENQELAAWLTLGYTDPAHAHFKRGQYFQGMNLIRLALYNARLRKIPNLAGEGPLQNLVSPLIIIETYLPTEPELAQTDIDFSELAISILNSDFEDAIEITSSNASLNSLHTYLNAIKAFRASDYISSRRQFIIAASKHTADDPRNDLSHFMAIRSGFWQLHEDFKSSDLQSIHADSNDGERYMEKGDREYLRLFKLFAKTFVRELQAVGALSTKGDKRIYGSRSLGIAEIKLKRICASATSDMKHSRLRIASQRWKDQANDYLKAAHEICSDTSK